MRFLTLKRFATEKEWAEKFVAMLRLSLYLVVESFACATLTKVVMRVPEVENSHERHHMAKGNGQSSGQ